MTWRAIACRPYLGADLRGAHLRLAVDENGAAHRHNLEHHAVGAQVEIESNLSISFFLLTFIEPQGASHGQH